MSTFSDRHWQLSVIANNSGGWGISVIETGNSLIANTQLFVYAGLGCEVEVVQLPAGERVRQFEAGFPSSGCGGLNFYSK